MLTLARYALKTVFPTQAELRVLLLGLDGGGKSLLHREIQRTVFLQLKNTEKYGAASPDDEEGYRPTMGSAVVARGKHGGIGWSVTDVGGREKQRRAWENYFGDTHFVVWCVDASADHGGRGRIGESAEVMHATLEKNDQLAHCPVCVVVRGADESCKGEIARAFDVEGDHDFGILWEHEMGTGAGVGSAVASWLVSTAKTGRRMALRRELVEAQEQRAKQV